MSTNWTKKLFCVAVTAALSVGASAYELNILHINDHHSHLQANRLDLKLDGKRTRVAAGGFASVTAAFAELGAGKMRTAESGRKHRSLSRKQWKKQSCSSFRSAI